MLERAIGDLSANRRRAIRDGLVLAGLLFNVQLITAWAPHMIIWVDALAWRTIDLSDIYSKGEGTFAIYGAFRYAPVVAWLMYPLTVLPWAAFFLIFLGANVAAVAALGRRWTLLLVLAFPPVLLELLNGNIHLFMALAIWAGMRWPAAWAFVLLTKVTPGVGVLWFAFRREWRKAAIAVAFTAAIVAVGWAVAPGQWVDWVRSLLLGAQVPSPVPLPPLWMRVPVAILVVWFAARTDRAWLAPIACVVAMPIPWLQSLALLTACFPLWWDRRVFERPRREPRASSAETSGVREAVA